MNRVLKILALAALVITIIGACVVLYGINTLSPQVVQVNTTLTPADQALDMFDDIVKRSGEQLLDGKVYGDVSSLQAQDCMFVTYTVRLNNRGFFPAEWISLNVSPVVTDEGSDVLQMASGGANVLSPGTQGDLAVTLLTTLKNPRQPRTIEIVCYVFGRKITVYAQGN